MVETYSSMGLVMDLYVAIIVSFCSPHVVVVRALSIYIVLRAVVVVISMCLGSRVSPIFLGCLQLYLNWESSNKSTGSRQFSVPFYLKQLNFTSLLVFV